MVIRNMDSKVLPRRACLRGDGKKSERLGALHVEGLRDPHSDPNAHRRTELRSTIVILRLQDS